MLKRRREIPAYTTDMTVPELEEKFLKFKLAVEVLQDDEPLGLEDFMETGGDGLVY